MSNKVLGQQMAEFFRALALEIESSPALARKLARPFQKLNETGRQAAPQKRQRKSKATVPEGFDPFRIYFDQGGLGLRQALETMDAATLKAVLGHFALDPTRSYIRWRKEERLSAYIVERVKALSHKGEAFRA